MESRKKFGRSVRRPCADIGGLRRRAPMPSQDVSKLPRLEKSTPVCCEPSCQLFCAAEDATLPARFGRRPHDAPPWISPDNKLRRHGVRYLQLGGDTWNRCGHGWLNIDGNFDRGDGAPNGAENIIFTDDTDRHNMKHVTTKSSRLPFADASVQFVYSEHMLEHMLPIEGGGVNFLRDAWRVLAPGGMMRLVTPDLAKYACALAGRGPASDSGFLEQHASRFRPMEMLTNPPSRATTVNNIFRNYGHQWIYDFEELKHALRYAGINPSYACRSDRTGRGLPRWARLAMRRANAPKNDTQTCWLDQVVREGESMYVNVFKPLGGVIIRR